MLVPSSAHGEMPFVSGTRLFYPPIRAMPSPLCCVTRKVPMASCACRCCKARMQEQRWWARKLERANIAQHRVFSTPFPLFFCALNPGLALLWSQLWFRSIT